jgi:EF-P beta-lysylation protein EpmB
LIQTIEDGSPSEPEGEILASRSDLVQASSEVDWQLAMKRAVRCSGELRRLLGLESKPSPPAAVSFPTFVPLEFLRRIRPGDENDPLLRQVLPRDEESQPQDGFGSDPVGDLDALAAGGLLHKYSGRALVITTGACGIHCRYCFRREFPYQSAGSRQHQWQPAIDYLAQNRSIDEVILSGGDPLTLVDSTLGDLIDQIESIGHVRRLRLHTRMPVVIPQRVTAELVDRLAGSRLAVWMVIHVNHPQELDQAVLSRLARLSDAGIPLLNQAVLLRGVNDDSTTLEQLCRTLVNHRIQPYYLHQLDRVRGAAHFEVPPSRGRELMDQLRAALPGYAVPKYVVERPGEESKSLLH